MSDTAFVTDFQVEVCENGSHQDAKHKPELLKELKQNLVIMALAIQTRIPRTIPASLCLDESYRLAVSGQWIREKESIIYLGDGKGSNKWNVITNHSFDTVETVSNKSKSTSLIQKKDTWESNTTNNGAEWNCSDDTFLKLICQINVSRKTRKTWPVFYLVDMWMKSCWSFDLMLHPEHIVLWDISFVWVTCQRLSQNASWSSQKSLGCSTSKHFRF